MKLDLFFKRYIFLVLLGTLALGVTIYGYTLKFMPELYINDYGLSASDIKWSIYNTQKDFYKLNGKYSSDLRMLRSKLDMSNIVWGWKSSFEKDIAILCNDCTYAPDYYKLIVVERSKSGNYVWSVSSNGDILLLKKK